MSAAGSASSGPHLKMRHHTKNTISFFWHVKPRLRERTQFFQLGRMVSTDADRQPTDRKCRVIKLFGAGTPYCRQACKELEVAENIFFGIRRKMTLRPDLSVFMQLRRTVEMSQRPHKYPRALKCIIYIF